MTALSTTSIPRWARDAHDPPRESTLPSGAASWLLVPVGEEAHHLALRWAEGLPADVPTELVAGTSADGVAPALDAALEAARVGVRVAVAGPVADCLALRGQLVSAGLEDDELLVAPTSAAGLEVFCVHCGATTRATAEVGDVVACDSCDRGLFVYHHVSRRDGRFLGFQADAETATDPTDPTGGDPR
ncbi:dimethylamine monooxygenase subunit DmmA family protein [Nocardioides flavescens]|uniref:Dimethylamine monooxygenase subunit DmmA-like C-terminal domain-containing protein n=1 Tax=Nocardioides flavescens TaxID=2691959 RepID=A0A6L7EU73_9ACTN|nr:dimethylamine monooxygenase subunit DmmA family protein [Nocardioides flavescens]MXG89216.1 hypothetical protein [Nocardioides flavescens]